jgi:mycothiol synthase
MPEKPCTVVRCPPHWRPAALRKLHDSLPAELQAGLAQALHVTGATNAAAWDGLLIAASDPAAPVEVEISPDSITGVAWVQRLPGETACLWIPPNQGAIGSAIMRAAAGFVDERQIPLTQLVVSPDDGYSDAECSAAGFSKFATLRYLYADLADDSRRVDSRGQSQTPSPLAFAAHAEREPDRLERVVEQTYVGTLDCPGLDGVRPLAEVLEGYRAQGTHRPEHWYLAQTEGQDVGALILAEHPGLGNWELVYMGVAVDARGRGFGARIVEFAIDVAARHHAERLVLAVDAANEPALRVYGRLGFITWAERIVYARLRARA